MKLLLIPVLSSLCLLPFSNPFSNIEKPEGCIETTAVVSGTAPTITFQDESGSGKMRSIVFKAQEYCRAELPDFEFDAHFKVLSATVYFTGTNFTGVEKGYIQSSSLKPIKDLMDRCQPGTIVVFDDVRVIGPDNIERTIAGITLKLF